MNKISIALFFIVLNLIYLFFKNSKKFNRYLKIFFPIIIFISFQFFILFGFFRVYNLEHKHENLYKNLKDVTVIGIVQSEINKSEYYNYFDLKVESVNYNLKFKGTKITVRVKKDLKIEYGDRLVIKGEFLETAGYKNKGIFQYKDYCKTLNIYGSVTAKKVDKIDEKRDLSFFSYKIRQHIKKNIDDYFGENESAVLKGILLGDTDDISDDIKNDFRDSSISHVLAVSGAHISCIIIGVNLVCGFFLKSSNLKKIFIILILSFFTFIVGFSPSVIRAVFMVILGLLSKLIHRKSNVYFNLVISSLLILIVNPYYIISPSFLLSFLATLGIVYMYKKCKIKLKNKFLNYVLNLILVSIYANLFIFPIMAYFFNQISFSFFITNLFISPIILGIELIGMLFLIFPNEVFSFVLNILLNLLIFISNFCSQIPLSKIFVSSPWIVELVFYYLVILFLTTKKYRYILKKILIIFIIIILLFNLFFYFDNRLIISFIDVGQGDSTLIETQAGKVIIIDGGGSDTYDIGKNVLMPYLLNKRIRKIDYMFISHFDTDHVGGLFYIMENLKVQNIIIGKQFDDTENLRKFLEIANKKRINVNIVSKGSRINIEKDLYFDVIWPDSGEKVSENSINNNAMVCKMNYNNFSVLFTGDIEEKAENILTLKYKNTDYLNSTVLKVGHHGSDSSSIQEFLDLVKPKIALIGVGLNNKYGHPDNQVLERLQKLSCKIYRTDLNGEINIMVSKGNIKIKKNNK